MVSKFKFVQAVLICLLAQSRAEDWTDDFTVCNMYRLIDLDCPKDKAGAKTRYSIIPATQRTNNVPGYALDITPWSTSSQMWFLMEAYTPVLPVGSVFEMYTTV